jgi:hypothetical protein
MFDKLGKEHGRKIALLAFELQSEAVCLKEGNLDSGEECNPY